MASDPFLGFYQGLIDVAGYTGNRAVVAMTDGYDIKSMHGATEIIAEAKRTGVRIFTVGLGSKVDEGSLKAISLQTGGEYYPTPTSDKLKAIYLTIAGTLKNQYVVTYPSAVCGPGGLNDPEHELKIEVIANARYGYDTERFHCPAVCKP